MNDLSINEQYDSIVQLLQQRRLKEAQVQTESLLTAGADWTLGNRLEQNKTSYQYMLQYMRQGLNDPQRQTLYLQLGADLWEIADQARIAALDKTSAYYYHELRRNRAYMSSPAPTLEDRLHTLEDLADDMALGKLLPQDGQIPDGLLRKHEEANRLLFLSTWSNSAWNAIDKQQAAAFLTSELLPENDLCLLVSAVTMSLLECFDAAKCLWMLEAARHRKTSVEQRALTGLVLVLLRHGNRISLYYPQLTETFQLYQEEYNLKKQLNRICLQLLRSRDTEKIDRKMREEIIPEVMKNVDFLRKMKFESDEPEENDWNPDWTNAFEKNGLGDKIREINELQMAGSDVYMSTFSMLKGFPFFNEISNWFLPFDRHHSTIIQSLKNLPESDKAASLILDAGLFCDSDKYSMAFTLAQLPKGQRGLMMQQFNNRGLEEIIDEQQFGHIRQHAARPEIISNQYIHDLYRFFKLFRRKNEFKDPFREDMNPYHNPILRTLMTTAEDIQPIADYFFQNNYLEEALELYREQASVEGTPDIYQKIGYCLQKGKRYREAIESYQTADALYPNQAWTLRHLGTCHRMLKDYSAALEYYQKADALQPDNYHILFHIGTCLAGMERYDEALQYFFRLDLMKNDKNLKIWRAIGWCSLLCGRWGQAAKYYARIPEKERTADDWLNAGHVAWVSGDVTSATDYYRQSAALYGNHATFREAFEKDSSTLVFLGIPSDEIPLMEDLVI